MKVTVCELRNTPLGLEQDWRALVSHVADTGSDLVLLPEMPFGPWPALAQPDPKTHSALWDAFVIEHQAWLEQLPELAPSVVVGTRPIWAGDRGQNVGFVWTREEGIRPAHTKRYLPNEDGFWEAAWYDPGPREFHVFEVAGLRLGFLICTELWFAAHCREYARAGVHLVVTPRATPLSSLDKWVAGGRVAAVIAGAYELSSNRGGVDPEGLAWGGGGWVIDPEGEVLALTDRSTPFVTVDIAPAVAEAAKTTYPRYVKD